MPALDTPTPPPYDLDEDVEDDEMNGSVVGRDAQPRVTTYDAHASLMRSWRLEPGVFLRFRRWLGEATPYRWRERARRRGFWRRRAIPVTLVLLGAIVAVIAGNIGISAIRQATRAFASVAAVTSAQKQPTPGSIIISPLNTSGGTPTPGPTIYTLGVWTSDANPNGSVTVFVRVSQSDQAITGAKVSLQVSFGSGGYTVGPLTTDGYGEASTQINVGGAGGAPVFLTATTTVNGTTFSGSYTFVTGIGAAAPTPAAAAGVGGN